MYGGSDEAWLAAERREAAGQRRMARMLRCNECGEIVAAGAYLPLPGGSILCQICGEGRMTREWRYVQSIL